MYLDVFFVFFAALFGKGGISNAKIDLMMMMKKKKKID